MTSEASSKAPLLYILFLDYVVVPFLMSLFGGLVGKSAEFLRVIISPTGKRLDFGNKDATKKDVVLHLDHPVRFAIRLLLDRKLGLGESFMAADWRATPGPTEFLRLLIRARKTTPSSSSQRSPKKAPVTGVLSSVIFGALRRIVAFFNFLQHRIRDNTLSGSAANIRDHYDLGNDMFRLFLDPSMTYSCAIFQETVTTADVRILEEAQMRKYDAILERLNIRPGDKVLEIGCGWGALAVRATKRYECRWTGLTLSREQLEFAEDRVRSAGLEGQIELKYLDYRLETGMYDHVIAVEMVEAVGEQFLPVFFQCLHDRLKPGGTAVIQAITCPDSYYERYCRSSDFIKKHIFPGGHMPSEGAIRKSLPNGLEYGDQRHIGRHYAITLDHWHASWIAHEKDILDLGYSPFFYRKWRFYFALCSALFSYGNIDTIQLSLHKTLNLRRNAQLA